MASKRKKLLLVQLSRAIAIMFVLLGHLNILFYQQFGYDWFDMGKWERTGGVDFFFIVTGFMIYYLYHNDVGVPGKTSQFLLKRAIRIYPLYWIFTTLAVMVSILIPSLDGEYSIETIVKSVFIFPTEPILASTWSLSHVILFYLLFSAYLYRPRILKPILTFWVLLSVLTETNLIPVPQTFLSSFSNLEILLGCLVAYITLHFSVKGSLIWVIMGLLGYTFVWVNNIYSVMQIHGPSFYCFFSMLIMLGLSGMEKVDRKIPKVLSYLGNASYSIYIAHWPFLQLYILIFKKLNMISTLGYFISMILIIGLTTFSTCLVYSLLEKPLSNYLRRRFVTNKKEKIPFPAVLAK